MVRTIEQTKLAPEKAQAPTPTLLAPQPRTYKVIILNSLMSDWTAEDTAVSDEAIRRMKRGLNAVGHDVTTVTIRRDIAGALKGFDPREYVIFNWCEGIDGAPNAYDAVPPVLE